MQRAGFVLVGGQSTRMGRDKALLPLRETPDQHSVLVEHVASQVASVAGNVALVGSPERYRHLQLECIADLQPGFGPLSGIHAALSQRRAALNLVVACDMPCLSSDLLAELFERAQAGCYRCVAAEDAVSVHPLCAVYHADALPTVERAMHEGQFRLTSLLRALDVVSVHQGSSLPNCNTPQEWQHMKTFVVP